MSTLPVTTLSQEPCLIACIDNGALSVDSSTLLKACAFLGINSPLLAACLAAKCGSTEQSARMLWIANEDIVGAFCSTTAPSSGSIPVPPPSPSSIQAFSVEASFLQPPPSLVAAAAASTSGPLPASSPVLFIPVQSSSTSTSSRSTLPTASSVFANITVRTSPAKAPTRSLQPNPSDKIVANMNPSPTSTLLESNATAFTIPSPPTPSYSSSLGLIAGATVASLLAFCILTGAIVYMRKRRKAAAEALPPPLSPFKSNLSFSPRSLGADFMVSSGNGVTRQPSWRSFGMQSSAGEEVEVDAMMGPDLRYGTAATLMSVRQLGTGLSTRGSSGPTPLMGVRGSPVMREEFSVRSTEVALTRRGDLFMETLPNMVVSMLESQHHQHGGLGDIDPAWSRRQSLGAVQSLGRIRGASGISGFEPSDIGAGYTMD
ncbi:hypothetical protein BC830DRAFT_1107973, partial [Chytriomyces sp. MP71]